LFWLLSQFVVIFIFIYISLYLTFKIIFIFFRNAFIVGNQLLLICEKLDSDSWIWIYFLLETLIIKLSQLVSWLWLMKSSVCTSLHQIHVCSVVLMIWNDCFLAFRIWCFHYLLQFIMLLNFSFTFIWV